LGGKIWIESESGIGTTVIFTIPFNKPTEDKNQFISANENITPIKRAKILIAEDEESNYVYLNEILNAKTESVLWAQNGEEAINIFKANKDISLILMDLKIPMLNGCEAARQIKEIDPNVPIIAQTAYTMQNYTGCNTENLFDAYITKPINREVLYQTIEQYLILHS
jgi:CheY-like chemotaxis protein